MSDEPSLDVVYDAYEQIEEAFWTALDESLNPRGPSLLYDLVRDVDLRPGAAVIDVGCGDGKHALELAERFEVFVRGFDPVVRHIEHANRTLQAAVEEGPGELGGRVCFELGVAEALPVQDASVDLIWCRDFLALVADLDTAYGEFRRVLRDDGRAVVYQSLVATGPLEPGEVDRLRAAGIATTSTDSARIDAAIVSAGLHVDERLDVGLEWGEWSEEQSGKKSRALRHLARLLRAPERYVAQFGQAAFDIMLADCFWHVDHMTGRFRGYVYVLSPT